MYLAVDAGYMLTCQSYPTSEDIELEVDVENAYFADPNVWK